MPIPSKAKPPVFYSLRQAAGALAVSPKTVRRRIKEGALRAHRVGGQLRISDEDFRTYIAGLRE